MRLKRYGQHNNMVMLQNTLIRFTFNLEFKLIKFKHSDLVI